MRVELKTNLTVSLTREFRRPSLLGLSFMVICLFTPALTLAGEKSSADFLKIPIGAEAAGMGQAYSALAQGVNALNSNPAGLINQPAFLSAPSMGLGFSHQEQFADTSLDHLGLVMPQGPSRVALGFNLVRLSYGSQEKRDSNRQEVGSFEASDMSLGAAMAKNFGPVQLGTQIKWIRMDLAGTEASGVAGDFGAMAANVMGSRFSLGVSARNLGPKMNFVSEDFNLPLTFALGTAFQVMGPLSLSVELQNRPYQSQTAVAIGTQMLASNTVTLRAGYLAKVAQAVENNQKSETNRGNFTNIGGLAAGMGIRLNQFTIDYAITPFGELGNSHSITLSSWFGGQKPVLNNPELSDPTPTVSKEEKTAEPVQDNRDILILPNEDDPLNRQLQ